MRADLHVHSIASDGTLTPTQVVERAHANGVSVLAIADHDSVAGLREASTAALSLGVLLIPAVELSAVADGLDVHILGYFVDPNDAELAEMLSSLREARQERAEAMVRALRDAGYQIGIDDVLAVADGGSVGRSHIARALVDAGHAENVAHAFQTLIGRGRPFYVAKQSAAPGVVIERLRRLRALPVLAHPGVTKVDNLIDCMIEAGLLGIEAYHADHTPEQRAHYADIAAERGLLVTGGSDFHGPEAPNPDIGAIDLPAENVQALIAAGGAL
jgi:predicted metal-dependent phosphoesterase TrpH